jgi:hypothetical protein
MMKQTLSKFGMALLLLAVCAAGVRAQKPAERARRPAAAVTPVRLDGSEAMFTTMCLLYASGFEVEPGDASPID